MRTYAVMGGEIWNNKLAFHCHSYFVQYIRSGAQESSKWQCKQGLETRIGTGERAQSW